MNRPTKQLIAAPLICAATYFVVSPLFRPAAHGQPVAQVDDTVTWLEPDSDSSVDFANLDANGTVTSTVKIPIRATFEFYNKKRPVTLTWFVSIKNVATQAVVHTYTYQTFTVPTGLDFSTTFADDLPIARGEYGVTLGVREVQGGTAVDIATNSFRAVVN